MHERKEKEKGKRALQRRHSFRLFSPLTNPDVAVDDAARLVLFVETLPSESILLRLSIALPIDSKKIIIKMLLLLK